MLKAPWRNRDDIVSENAFGKVSVARGEHIGGPLDASAGPGRYGAQRVVKDGAVFNFDKRHNAAAPGNQVDLAALGPKTARQDAVPFQLQYKSGGPFGTATSSFSAPARCFSILCVRAHDFFRSDNARS